MVIFGIYKRIRQYNLKIYKPGIHLIICGAININYLIESKEKQELKNIDR